MNHLREILDCRPCLSIEVPVESREPMWAMFTATAENAVCFDAGEADGLLAVEQDLQLCRLPYPTIWVEFNHVKSLAAPVVIGLLVRQHVDASTSVFSVVRREGIWTVLCYERTATFADGLRRTLPATDEASKIAMTSWVMLCKFLTALYCRNVTRQLNQPDAPLQKARARRGKLPLFSYWTLHLGADEGAPPLPGDGTRASPRVHLRMGHWKKNFRDPTGPKIWVQECKVGAGPGIVHKDYQLAAA